MAESSDELIFVLALGIIGDYIGLIFIQLKGRSPVIIKDIYRS